MVEGTSKEMKPKVTHKTQEEQGRECRRKVGLKTSAPASSVIFTPLRNLYYFSPEEQSELPLPLLQCLPFVPPWH